MTTHKAIPRPEKKLTPQQAMIRLETMCARAERSTRELRDKLWQWGITSGDADKIIDSLTQRRFVDDRRFAGAFVNDKVRFARWGRRKIKAGLASKRIDSNIVTQLLDEIDTDLYYDNLITLLRLKASSVTDPRNYDGRTKLFRYALSRGYEPDIAANAIRELFT